MKTPIIVALALCLISALTHADATNKAAYSLIHKARQAKKIRKLDESPVVKFLASPNGAVEQGAPYSVFISPVNTYTDSNILLDAKLNGQDAALIRSSENLWIYHAEGFSEIRSNTLTIDLAVENRALGNQLRKSIDKLSTEIFNLQKKIDLETDPVKRNNLIAQRDEKIAIKTELLRQLAALKTPLASQSFSFEVVQAQSGVDFPKLTAISPQAGSAAGGTPLVISGVNFVAGMTVKLGGITVPASLVSPTTITALSPDFGAATGIKDLEVRFPPLLGKTEPRNSFLRNAFFATNSSLEANVKPVAVAGVHQSALIGAEVELDGSQSYDPNPGTSLSYAWKVVSAPHGSNLTPGQVLTSVQKPRVTPSVAGFYVFELKVSETNTPDAFTSEPSLATVEITLPANAAPAPTAPSISTPEGVVGTTTVAPNDPDASQSWTFAILTPPAHGVATITAYGVVTFVPNANFTGADSLTVRVTDNGNPMKYGDVEIPVTVIFNNPPVPSAPSITVTEGQQSTSQVTANDPDSSQAWTYSVQTQALHGAAVVSTSGLVTFTAATGYFGADSVTIRVTDNGIPAKFGDVVIPITINQAPNQLPVVGSPGTFIRSQGTPVSVRFSTIGASDPDGTIVEWRVNFGDGSPEGKSANLPGNTFSLFHDYIAIGTYSATVSAVDNRGGISSSTISVDVTDKAIPTAKFSPNVISGAAPLTVNFDASASSNEAITQYRWNWSDGSSEEVGAGFVTRSHTFGPGSYRVRLRTRDAGRGEGESFVWIYSGTTPPATGTSPTADFRVLPGREVLINTSATFDGSRSFDPNPSGSIANYNWLLNDGFNCGTPDGCPVNGSSVNHTYTNAFNHFPSLEVTSATGGTAISATEVWIVNAPNAPRAVMANFPSSGTAPYQVNLDGLMSYDVDGPISSYTWRIFDSGCPGGICVYGGPTASHTFTQAGVHTVTLEVTDSHSNMTVAYKSVTVNPAFKKDLRALLNEGEDDSSRAEQKRILTGACSTGDGRACYYLSRMHEEDGDAYTATELRNRACSLGYQAACSL